MDRARVLLIDDESEVLEFLSRALEAMEFAPVTATSGAEGLEKYRTEGPFDVVVSDLRMPGATGEGIDGIEMTRRLREFDPEAVVIVVTGYASIHSAVEAMKAGAMDYLTKPVALDHLEIVLNRAIDGRRRIDELNVLREQVARQGSFEGLVGVSAPMRRVYELIRQLAQSEITVLLQGETGTGKELVARAIHKLSDRAGAFMPIHCGALPEEILESELFGHERGAFTGAVKRKFGLIEQAEKGTLFLDEIGQMSPALQVKLLRAIQEREVLRVGGERAVPVDFRLVAATNQELREEMEQGRFRADLFYRVSVMVVELPPLRDRGEDIALLARYFARKYATVNRHGAPGFTPEAMMLLDTYDWPGNVRELENVIAQAVFLSRDGEIGMEHLPEHLIRHRPDSNLGDAFDLPLREARSRFEREYLKAVLNRSGGRVAEAARRAGINRKYFYQKMEKLGISRPEDEGDEGEI